MFGFGMTRAAHRRRYAAGAPSVPTFAIAAAAAQNEGNSGTTLFSFPVTRAVVTTGSHMIDWAVTGSGGNPANAADFGGTLPSGTLTFLNGETVKNISVLVSGDTTYEPDEGFTVTLSNPSAGTIVTPTASSSILNDDAAPVPDFALSPSNVTHAEGNSGTTTYAYTVTRSVVTTGAASVDYAVTGSSASPANAADFGGTLPSGTVSFADGETIKPLDILVSGDTTVESDEEFTVTLSNPSAGTISVPTATGTITNDDSASVPFASVNADGWSVDYAATPPSLNPLTSFAVTRAGYTTTGGATSWADTLVVTQRTRQAYPGQASLSALTCALSDVIATGDTMVGATNNSTRTVPAPIANWAMLGRKLVGNTLTLEVTGNHWFARNGAPFACVEFSVTDGTTTVTARTSTLVVSSGHAGDRCAVLVYTADVDITSLATGLVTANARVWPWVGTAIADSTTSSVAREFSPRYFYKDVARAASPPFAYVASTGNDGTGVVSTTAATASATPFLTIQGAINGLIAATGVTGGYVDGCRIRVKDTVGHGASAASARTQKCAAVIVERDPNVAKSAAIVNLAATWRARMGVGTLLGGLTEGAITYSDVTVVRTGAYTWMGEAANQLNVRFADDMVYDNSGNTVAMLNQSHMWFDGVVFTNATATSVMGAGTYQLRFHRGVQITRADTVMEAYTMLGCAITRPGQLNAGTRTQSGSIVQFNKFISLLDITNAISYPAGAEDVTNFSFSQNLVEICHATSSNPGLRASSDSASGNMTHVLFDNNTMTGHYQAGRFNFAYDESAGAGRTHRWCRNRNSVLPALYNKGDVFATNGARIGNWAQLYAAGARNNMVLWASPGVNTIGATEGLAYAGLGSTFGTSATTPLYTMAALFTDYQGTTNSGTTAVAGTGGGTYTPATSSPLIGTVAAADEVFAYDLAGQPRDRGSAGAYR